MSLKSSILRSFFSLRSRSVERFLRRPLDVQREQFDRLLREGARTDFGRRYGLSEIRTPEEFARRVDRFDYDSFKGYIDRMLAGEADVAAPGRVRWFARSSGTTSERSKYLPVNDVSLWRCHSRGLRDVATFYVRQYPSTRVFEGKTLTLGGSCRRENGYVAGDLSAFSQEIQNSIRDSEAMTAHCERMTLTICANYGGRWDIVEAFRNILRKDPSIAEHPEKITEAMVDANLAFDWAPPVDLMIRTGGEQRISNFILWQAAYAELFASSTLWPDFDEKDLKEALDWYAGRERRFGMTGDQIKALEHGDK